MENLRVIAGLTAGGLTLLGNVIYLRAIWRRTSSTCWSTWLIWAITSFTALSTYYGSGARESIWVAVVDVVVCVVIFGAAVMRRSPGGLTRIEYFCLAGTVFSCAVWWMSGSAVHGQIAIVTIEVIAYIPIWLAAQDENRAGWTLETVGGAVNLLAISQFTVGLVFYPVALLASNSLVLGLIIWHGRVRPSPKAALAAQ